MNYPQSLAYLDRLGDEVLTMKFGLETIRKLLVALDNPHRKSPSVLVAGTNGKGSVARFLSSIFSACGIRNALYTSPHLVRLEERFCVGTQCIEPQVFAHYFTRLVSTIEELQLSVHPTYFETLTATAFLYFSEQQVEITFLEVGMGGRLDSTNVVDPLLCILTPIGLDHQKFLGDSMEAIAHEKAAILRKGRPALLAPQRPQVRRVVLAEAAAKKAQLIELDDSEIKCLGSDQGKYHFRFHGLECRLGLYGRHQLQNAALAIQAAEVLREAGFSISPEGIERGVAETCWGGRLQKVSEEPAVFLDGAHNLDAAQNLAGFLIDHTREPRSLVFATMRDKDIARILEILGPCFHRIYLTTIQSQRAASIAELKQIFPRGIPVPDPFDAYPRALQSTATVVVAGSFYLVGKILEQVT